MLNQLILYGHTSLISFNPIPNPTPSQRTAYYVLASTVETAWETGLGDSPGDSFKFASTDAL
jgi:hypothetical protein